MSTAQGRSLPVHDDRLADLVDPEELETFRTTLERFHARKVTEKVFTEYRLRYGTYGQRQDHVQMQRIKIPLGRVNPAQLEALAEVAEELADGILHVTTRQDIQVHFMKLDDAPECFERLAAVGITTREACGNTVRNVTDCPRAGVCADAAFDVDPYAQATARYLLRHPDTQDFGRKFKISFSGCEGAGCGLGYMHDIGAIAKVQDGERGFKVVVGGGLGAVPMKAKVLSEFVPADEMLPLTQATARVFARLGEKNVRSRARMKFVVEKLGIDAFRLLVEEERARLPHDDVWAVAFDEAAREVDESPAFEPRDDGDPGEAPEGFAAFFETNVEAQAQHGYYTVKLNLPLGDFTADQSRALAALARAHFGEHVRFTADQNLLLRWVPGDRLVALYQGLLAARLADPGARTLSNITACPGTDSCKLGITSSRGLAATLRDRLATDLVQLGRRDDLSVKISGCPNSCGQHHIADIGFSGSSKRKGDAVAPVFQVFLGGTASGNAERFGKAMGKVAATHAPEVTRVLTEAWQDEREGDEAFGAWVARVGRRRIAELLEPYGEIPTRDEAPELYRDNRQSWDYVRAIGVGECAGEVVTQAEFMLEDAERLVHEAGLFLDDGTPDDAAGRAWDAMVAAADALLSTTGLLKSDGYDTVAHFEDYFVKNGGGFHKGTAGYLLAAAVEEQDTVQRDAERVHHLVEEANLFVDEANVVYGKLAGAQVK